MTSGDPSRGVGLAETMRCVPPCKHQRWFKPQPKRTHSRTWVEAMRAIKVMWIPVAVSAGLVGVEVITSRSTDDSGDRSHHL